MSQIDRPARVLDQLLGQVGGAGATLEGGLHLIAIRVHEGDDGLGSVGTGAVGQAFALAVEDTHLDRPVVVVQTDKNSYSTHVSLLLVLRNQYHGCCSTRRSNELSSPSSGSDSKRDPGRPDTHLQQQQVEVRPAGCRPSATDRRQAECRSIVQRDSLRSGPHHGFRASC